MTEHSIAVGGLTLHYTLVGQGPDVIFIHGWLSSRRMWNHLIAELADSYRCWALDLPGGGDSDKPPDGWYSIPNYTAVLREFLRLSGLNHVRVVGHSMGGMVALDFAAERRGPVKRLVAINPVVSGQATMKPLARHLWGRPLLGLSLRLSPLFLQPVLNQPLLNFVNGMDYLRRRTQDFAKGTVESIVGSGRATVAYDVTPRLPNITAPTLILLGDRDRVVPNSEGRLAAERVPGARLVVMPGGHLVTDDRPAEAIDLLRTFLA